MSINVISKCIKPMLACKFHFIFYFYLIKTCNFNDNDLLLLLDNFVGMSHGNHQLCSHINGVC